MPTQQQAERSLGLEIDCATIKTKRSSNSMCQNKRRMIMYQQYNQRAGMIFTLLLAVTLLFNSGCAKIGAAIDNKDMSTSVKMSDTVFLEPVAPEKQTVWVRIRNTSDQQEIDSATIRSIISSKIEGRGYKVVNDPTTANYRMDANLLYASMVSDSLTAEMMTAGGFGGALGGAAAGGTWVSMGAGGLLGAAAGAAIGAAFKVKNFGMVIDVQVSEFVKGGVNTSIHGTGSSGGGTGKVGVVQTRVGSSNFLHHRTRIAATAKQTNLEMAEATPILIRKIAASLGGVF